jgi:hypothetical protein
MILYLSHWFPRKYLVTATALAGVIGGAISGSPLEMHGIGELSGW